MGACNFSVGGWTGTRKHTFWFSDVYDFEEMKAEYKEQNWKEPKDEYIWDMISEMTEDDRVQMIEQISKLLDDRMEGSYNDTYDPTNLVRLDDRTIQIGYINYETMGNDLYEDDNYKLFVKVEYWYHDWCRIFVDEDWNDMPTLTNKDFEKLQKDYTTIREVFDECLPEEKIVIK